MKIHHIAGHELDDDLTRQWAALQRAEPVFESAFFHPEFTRAVAATKSNVELGIVEDGGRALAFFPFERVSRRLGPRSAACYRTITGSFSTRPSIPPSIL